MLADADSEVLADCFDKYDLGAPIVTRNTPSGWLTYRQEYLSLLSIIAQLDPILQLAQLDQGGST